MKRIKYAFTILLLIIMNSVSRAQNNDTIPADTSSVNIISDSVRHDLLPEKYMLTQKLLWGKSGLMRNFSRFELNEENRDFELNLREKFFTAHRYAGYVTLAGMIAQGIVGERLYRGHTDLKDLHEGLAGFVNISYFTTAGLALFAPPPMHNRPQGFSTLKLHKYLSVIHLSSMIATNILSGMTEGNPKMKSWHRAAAYTAYGTFFVSMVVIHF